MHFALSCLVDIPAERAFDKVETSRLLEHVAAPVQVFEAIDAPAFRPQGATA